MEDTGFLFYLALAIGFVASIRLAFTLLNFGKFIFDNFVWDSIKKFFKK